ncbi:MAG: hypothetical protein K0T53_02210 [Wolbachia pipientis]|nr:hypothetical protein [Wolbachia pipientis]
MVNKARYLVCIGIAMTVGAVFIVFSPGNYWWCNGGLATVTFAVLGTILYK